MTWVFILFTIPRLIGEPEWPRIFILLTRGRRGVMSLPVLKLGASQGQPKLKPEWPSCCRVGLGLGSSSRNPSPAEES
ncbi:hypothetical protein V8E51_003194 [Hyaloscypha variabilis]